VIAGVRVLAGEALEPLDDALIEIDGRTITSIGPRPDHIEKTHAPGTTLLPGFIDAHVHIGFYEPAALLAGGVTTARDLGWPPQQIAEIVTASRADDFKGPTVVAAGPMLTAPGGYPTTAAWAPRGTGLEVAGPREAPAAVERVAHAGFTIIKIALNPAVGPVLDTLTLTAIVQEAHARGLKVTGHIYGLEELHKAVVTGVDELAHMLMSDEAIPEPTIARMVHAGMTVVPTLSIFSGAGMRTAIANLHAFRKAGGFVIYGTDLGNEGPGPGIDAREIKALSNAGMSGLDITRSATTDSARWLGLDSVGVIAPGMDADLVLVDGDPLADAAVLTKVVAVWRRGIAREL
jgi:imidazolonepropionase-like amidohydrolase